MLRRPEHPQFQETTLSGVAAARARTPGLSPRPAALRLSEHRGTRGICRRLPAPRPPPAGHKGRFVPGTAAPRPPRRAGGRPPPALGAGARGPVSSRARLFTQEGKAPPRPGPTGGGLQRGGCRLRAERHTHLASSPPDRTLRLAHLGVPKDALPFRQRPQPGPPRCLRAAARRTKFLCAARARLTWEAGHERTEPEQAGVQGRGGPRHGGGARPQRRRGRRAPRGPRAGAGARGPRAGGRSRMPGSQRPRPGWRSWRLRWPAPRRHHPSRSARSRVPGLPGIGVGGGEVAALDSPAGGSGPGRGGIRDGTATWAPGRSATLCPPPPPLPFLPPARQDPLSTLFSPPLLPPSKLPPGCHTVSLQPSRAGRAPGWASSAPRGDPPGTRSPGLPGGSPFRSAGGGAGAQRRWGGSRSAFLAARRHGEGAEDGPHYSGLLNLGRESRTVRPRRGRLVSPKAALPAARSREERPRRPPV